MHNKACYWYSRAKTDEELAQILEIQRRNTRQHLSPTEILEEGFVTVVHQLDVLRSMNQACPHIISSNNNRIVGYALAMDPVFREEVPVLAPLFVLTDKLMENRNYLIMGQICIDKPFRGQGIFSGMYRFYRKELRDQYECLVTEVAVENSRSMQAHKSVGFETMYVRSGHGKNWELLVWEWEK